jgi:DNA-binding transcriptional LysR family regulator
MVREKRLPLAFVYKMADVTFEFETVYLMKDHIVGGISKSNPLLPEKSVDIHALGDKNIRLLEFHTVLKNLSFDAFRKAGIAPNIVNTEKRFLSTYELENDNSIALFFKRDALFVDNPGNRLIEITPPIEAEVCLIYRKDHSLAPEEKYFIDQVKAFATKKN